MNSVNLAPGRGKVRIAFVDDESSILQGMRRTLHGMRNEWEMEFFGSGEAALASLASSAADVIVSDMRMPGMDGWEFLAEVKKRHPQSVRLLLSGYADPSSIMRSVGTAHQYMAKPCDSATIKAAIVQTQMLRSLLSSPRLALLVGHVELLPSTPKAFQEILACIRRPDATLVDAAQIIARDVAMTANILKLVNSAFFGSRQSITRIDRAVAYLGMDTLGSLVLAHGVFQSGVSIGIEGFSLEELWRHSLQTALLSKAIALDRGLSAINVEEAFLVGLLHDVGKIVFATRAPAVGDSAISNEEAVAQMQSHHAEVGAYLLGLWGFPNSIVEAVAFHHNPSQTADSSLGLAGIIHIADRLSRADGAIGATPADIGIEAGYLERHGVLNKFADWKAAAAGGLEPQRAAS
ncbi:MAG TPA: response regulator [Steroidobacteraceae bacterium]|jgi:putative nucleotidyltransferase with HDIG domain